MYLATNNHVREDTIFSGKVKAVIKACDGSLVAALEDFEARHDGAVAGGAGGIGYAEFLEYLRRHGVAHLSDFERNYLCNSFDDGIAPKKNLFISAPTFIRHLTGLNYRRMKAVRQAWSCVSGDPTATISAEELVNTFREAHSSSGAGAGDHTALLRESQLHSTFTTGRGGKALGMTAEESLLHRLARSRGRATAQPADGTAVADNDDDDEAAPAVRWVDFLAFYAGISPEYPSDEAFEMAVLKEWGADQPRGPKSAETVRDWGVEGDPLSTGGATHFVRDALNMSLGQSSKSYNLSHMTREPEYVEPLPPLNRPEIMESTVQREYKPYDEGAWTFSNPLATRRAQQM